MEKVSDSLRKTSGVVLNVKPGLMTTQYFSNLLRKLTTIGVCYLFFVSVFVDYFKVILNIDELFAYTVYYFRLDFILQNSCYLSFLTLSFLI